VHDLCGELGLRCEVANATGGAWAWKTVNLHLLPIRYRLLTYAEAASPVRGVRRVHEIQGFSSFGA
jgi:hypothetical protein